MEENSNFTRITKKTHSSNSSQMTFQKDQHSTVLTGKPTISEIGLMYFGFLYTVFTISYA